MTENVAKPVNPEGMSEFFCESVLIIKSLSGASKEDNSIKPTIGKITKVPIINIPCTRSVQATANKPPIIVYSMITTALNEIPYRGSISKIAFRILPAPNN